MHASKEREANKQAKEDPSSRSVNEPLGEGAASRNPVPCGATEHRQQTSARQGGAGYSGEARGEAAGGLRDGRDVGVRGVLRVSNITVCSNARRKKLCSRVNMFPVTQDPVCLCRPLRFHSQTLGSSSFPSGFSVQLVEVRAEITYCWENRNRRIFGHAYFSSFCSELGTRVSDRKPLVEEERTGGR